MVEYQLHFHPSHPSVHPLKPEVKLTPIHQHPNKLLNWSVSTSIAPHKLHNKVWGLTQKKIEN